MENQGGEKERREGYHHKDNITCYFGGVVAKKDVKPKNKERCVYDECTSYSVVKMSLCLKVLFW